MKVKINHLLLTLLMFVLVLLGEGLTLRSYCLYLVCGCIILQGVSLLSRHGNRMFLNAELALLLVFLLFGALSYMWAMKPALVFYRVKVLTFLTILVIIMTNYLYRVGGYTYFVQLYFVMGLLLSFACIIYFGPTGVLRLIVSGTRLGEDEALFMGINANTIALDCATAGIIATFYAGFRKKPLYLLALIPTLLIVVATGSRKGIAMLMIGIILAIFFRQLYSGKNKAVAFLKILLVIAVIIVVATIVLQLPGLEKINEQYMGLVNSVLGNTDKIDVSTASRNRMVTIGLEQFKQTPILGIGLDNAKIINAMYNNFNAYLHNNYIELLVNGGLVGFLIYYSFFAVLLVKHLRRLDERNPLVYISLTLMIIRLISDWGRVSYYDYMNIMTYSFWIAIANRFDMRFPTNMQCMEEAKR